MRLGASMLLAFLAACSKFGEESGPADGGVGPATTTDARPSTTTDSGGDAKCGGLPLEPFAAAETPAGWSQGGTDSTGTIQVTPGAYLGADGNFLHAIITNSTGVAHPPTLLSAPIAIAKHVRVEYDLAIAKAEHYGEIGCELDVSGPVAGEDRVVLYIGVEEAIGASLIAGWDYAETGKEQQSDETAALTGWQIQKWQHVVMDVTLDGSQVSADVSIGGGAPAKIRPPTAGYSFTEMHLRCGILYLRPNPAGAVQTMDVGIDNIQVAACP